MKTNVVRIGNSRGIRIPKKLLEECRLEDTVELEAHKDHLVVRSAPKPRSGWDDAFLAWRSKETTRCWTGNRSHLAKPSFAVDVGVSHAVW